MNVDDGAVLIIVLFWAVVIGIIIYKLWRKKS